MVGDTYTIVDMACGAGRGWSPFVLGDEAVAKYPNVKRLVDEISARPAAAKAIALKDNFKFKAEMDDEARGNMFRHLGSRRPDQPPAGWAKERKRRAHHLSQSSTAAGTLRLCHHEAARRSTPACGTGNRRPQ